MESVESSRGESHWVASHRDESNQVESAGFVLNPAMPQSVESDGVVPHQGESNRGEADGGMPHQGESSRGDSDCGEPHRGESNRNEPPLTPAKVFEEYAPRIYHLARRMLDNDADAEDVTQEVLLQVVRKLDTFRGEAALPTWLHRVTVNAALAHREKNAQRNRQRIDAEAEEYFGNHPPLRAARKWSIGPEEVALNLEQREMIEKAIRNLPETYRDIYILADVEELPNAEIAQMLQLSVPAVKSRLHRARALMRDALAPHFEEPQP